MQPVHIAAVGVGLTIPCATQQRLVNRLVMLLQADLQKEVERAKSLAEAEGRIKENRENEDVNRRAALLK
jgi:hypothetical protein